MELETERNDCLNLRGENLEPQVCESLEEVLKRVQFKVINLEGTSLEDEVIIIDFFILFLFINSSISMFMLIFQCYKTRFVMKLNYIQ